VTSSLLPSRVNRSAAACPERWMTRQTRFLIWDGLRFNPTHRQDKYCAFATIPSNTSHLHLRPYEDAEHTSHNHNHNHKHTVRLLPEPHPVPTPPSSTKTQRYTANMSAEHTYKFNVSMSCGGCSGAVNRVLGKLEGTLSFPSSSPCRLPSSSDNRSSPHSTLRRLADHNALRRCQVIRCLPRYPNRNHRRCPRAILRDCLEDDQEDWEEGQQR
jgi:hypothetical protein